MKKLLFRLCLAWWAARNPDVLTMLHFEMLRDGRLGGWNARRSFARRLGGRNARRYAARLKATGMPGVIENEAAL